MTKELAAPMQELHLMARDPAEMMGAQKQLILWCARKMQAEKAELADSEANLAQAKKAKWATKPWARRVNLQKRRIEFYRKVKMALEAGYYIVPPFPVDVFAIRTDRKKPDKKTTTYRYSGHGQSARLLPAGEGRYVSNHPEIWETEKPGTDRDGREITIKEWWAEEFQPVDFPFIAVKPEVIDATNKAMARKLFDEFGVLPARGCGDPIVVGRIKKPNQASWAHPLTFFIAWWLDTEDI